MGRPRKHDEQTRQTLLEAAEQLLSESGVDALSLRNIAARAGTTTRAVYSVFEGKPGLWSALYQHSFQILGTAVVAHRPSGDAFADLLAVALIFRRFALDHPNLYRLAFERLLPGLEPDARDNEVALHSLEALHRYIERAIDAGIIAGRSVEHAGMQFHAACQGLASIEPLGWLGRGPYAEAMWRDTIGELLRGMREPPVAPMPREGRPQPRDAAAASPARAGQRDLK